MTPQRQRRLRCVVRGSLIAAAVCAASMGAGPFAYASGPAPGYGYEYEYVYVYDDEYGEYEDLAEEGYGAYADPYVDSLAESPAPADSAGAAAGADDAPATDDAAPPMDDARAPADEVAPAGQAVEREPLRVDAGPWLVRFDEAALDQARAAVALAEKQEGERRAEAERANGMAAGFLGLAAALCAAAGAACLASSLIRRAPARKAPLRGGSYRMRENEGR